MYFTTWSLPTFRFRNQGDSTCLKPISENSVGDVPRSQFRVYNTLKPLSQRHSLGKSNFKKKFHSSLPVPLIVVLGSVVDHLVVRSEGEDLASALVFTVREAHPKSKHCLAEGTTLLVEPRIKVAE